MAFDWDQVPATEVTISGAGNTNVDAITAGTSEEVLVLGIFGQLVNDATVATRTLSLRHFNGSLTVLNFGGVQGTASQTVRTDYFPGAAVNSTPTGGSVQQPIPHGWILPPGHSARFVATNGVAGDAITGRAIVKRRKYGS